MAVQAQYPSNVLLLNRGVQDGKIDCSLQPQPGGFLDQSHMLFNNGVVANSRKRGREVFGNTNTGGVVAPTVNSFPLQPQPSQLIDLSVLHNHQPNVVSTGLRLAFGEQHLQHPQQQQQQQQQQQNQQQQSAVLSLLSEDFTAQIKHQRDEIDQFLRAQGEQLRRTLAEKRQRHYRALLGAAEESVARRLREKEAEVEKAARCNAELEARAAQLSMEAQVWQAKARAQEATAASLQAQLQQAMMSGGGCSQDRRGEEGLGCAVGAEGGGCSGQAEDAESAYIDPERVKSSGPMCKACRKRVASVVLLPCRHFCICTQCDGVVQACPLCLSLRDSSVEVFLS
ncbi:putative BOI-related E3 ubiquitin-protein ligase 3 [Vitis vinifera]|uniref:Putative BOI-related E3 ubiquitin-protein ligase 3 n=1 Tax=Vitis vinifera TaxID=29760 RepID=A0A438ITZ5_VITVI|nr:putative BOI-related E3 ubiquitin-protein ligase 3 [Vitis vinifera]